VFVLGKPLQPVNYASSVVNKLEVLLTDGVVDKLEALLTDGVVDKLEALLNDDATGIIYDHHVFIVQATGLIFMGKTTSQP
jgi:hypothetical protein